MHIIPILSTLVTFIFAVAVFRRYQTRGGIHLFLWTIGLLFYGMGTLGEVVLAITFNEWVLKFWYIGGAMLTAAWLGQGTMHLLVRKGNTAKVLTGILAAVSLLAFGLVLSTPLTSAVASYNILEPVSGQYKEIMTRSGTIILLTVLLNIYGTIGLVGGAIYSAFLFWRKRVLANRMYGNLLIAAGALSPAIAGTFVKAGLVDLLYISELIGVILIYAGFVLATSKKAEPVVAVPA